jgi:hypothetical protein
MRSCCVWVLLRVCVYVYLLCVCVQLSTCARVCLCNCLLVCANVSVYVCMCEYVRQWISVYTCLRINPINASSPLLRLLTIVVGKDIAH